MKDFITLVKALGDQNRIRALMALQDNELCLCHLIELLELAPSTVSKHMSILKQARLVHSRKQGRWVYYRLAGKTSSKQVRDAISFVFGSLTKKSFFVRDKCRIRKITASNITEQCS